MSAIKKNVINFAIFFTAFYLLATIMCFCTTSGNTQLFELQGYKIIGALLFTSVCFLWNYNCRNTLLAGSFVGLWIGATLCKLGTGMVLSEREIVQTIEMSIALYSICSVLFYALSYIPSKKFFVPLHYIFLLLFGVLLLQPLLVIGYFIASHKHMLSANVLLTLFQTNREEIKSYLVEQNLLLWALTSFAILFIIGIFVYAVNGLKPEKNNFALLFHASLMVVVCIFCFPRMNSVYITNIYFRVLDTLNEYDQYDDISINRQTRLQKLKNILRVESDKPQLHVLVIGEATVRHHLSAFGYERKTTPWLDELYYKNDNMLFFPHAYSNNIQTVMALQQTLTSQNQYNGLSLQEAHSLIEAASAANYETYWISNQMHFNAYDTPIATIANGADHQIFINDFVGKKLRTTYYDDKLAEYFPTINPQKKVLIIFHLMGCHNVYSDRYPRRFKNFKNGPDKRVDEYDNCVLYNDHVLSLLYKKAIENSNFMSFTFLSDHGEDPDKGLTHDYSKFTWNMAHIPFFSIFSDAYMEKNQDIIKTLKKNKEQYWTSDLLYELMLSILGIKDVSYAYEQYDLSSAEYNMDRENLTIINGEKSLQDDIDL